MKNIIYGIMVVSIVLMSNCNSEKNKNNDWCQDVVQKTSDYIFNYQKPTYQINGYDC